MRTWCAVLLWAGAGGGGLVGCASLGPSPDEMAADLPPAREVTSADAQKAEEHSRDALHYLRVGDYGAAQRAAQDALDLDPRAARARAVFGSCLMVQAQQSTPPDLRLWQQAEGELRRAAELAPADAEIALLQAEFLEADGHLSGAAERLDTALESNRGDTRLLREAGRVHYELGEERAALAHLVRLQELGQAGPRSLYRIAQCRLRLALTAQRIDPDKEAVRQAFVRAAESFAEYREAAPEDSEGYSGEAFARFQLFAMQKDPQPKALEPIVELYAQAVARNETSPEPEFNLGTALEAAGRADDARLAYERALERDPEHLPSLINLTANFAAAGEVEEAVKYCRRALALGPGPRERGALESFLRQHEVSPPTAAREAAGKREPPR